MVAKTTCPAPVSITSNESGELSHAMIDFGHDDSTINIVLAIITHTRLTALFPGLPGCAGTRRVKPIWIFLKQETVSGSGISWAICKSAPCSRQITMPALHYSVFYRPDALPTAQPTASCSGYYYYVYYYSSVYGHAEQSVRLPVCLINVLQ